MKRTARTALSHAQGSMFRIEFEKVEFHSGEIFFVPKYGLGRPASRRVLNGDLYEPKTHKLVSAVLAARPGDMVHAGAFFGDMLPTFSGACAGTVYAFEPVLENYVLAKLCIEANGITNVFLLNAALGNALGIARVDTGEVDGTHFGGASKVGSVGQQTAVVTIDSLGLGNVSIIQLDVEGFELNALRGAARTIEQNSPVVMIEDNDGACQEYLRQLEYRACGSIPGLSIWTRPQHRSEIERLVSTV